MTGLRTEGIGDARCRVICDQATPHDARTLIDAMRMTQAGVPASGDLALSMARARRPDLFGLLPEYDPGFSFEAEMLLKEIDPLAALTRELTVGVGNGEFNGLDPELEERTGYHILNAGLITLDTLLTLDIKDFNVSAMGPPSRRNGSRWIMGKPFNSGLATGLLKGALNLGAGPHNDQWVSLLNLVAQQALERCTSTHQRANPTLDALIEFTLDLLGSYGRAPAAMSTAGAVMKLHGMRNEDGGRWPRARAACNRMVSHRFFCEAVATTPMQVRVWARLCDISGVMDPDIFVRAGSTPGAMGALAAWAVRTSSKDLLDQIRQPLSTPEWDEGERFTFTVSIVKELEWMDKYWKQSLQEMDVDHTRLPKVLACVHGIGHGTDAMASTIIKRLKTPAEDKQNIDDFSEELRSACSMMKMNEDTKRIGKSRSATPRL